MTGHRPPAYDDAMLIAIAEKPDLVIASLLLMIALTTYAVAVLSRRKS